MSYSLSEDSRQIIDNNIMCCKMFCYSVQDVHIDTRAIDLWPIAVLCVLCTIDMGATSFSYFRSHAENIVLFLAKSGLRK